MQILDFFIYFFEICLVICVIGILKKILNLKRNKIMKITKLETRQPWLCEVDGTTYVRTEIQWTYDRPNDITWHLNEDQVKGKIYLTDDQLEELFIKNN